MLNTPFRLKEKRIANRAVFQPMESCDCLECGAPSELTKKKYLRAARSGVGTVWFEACAVCPEGRTNERQMRLTEENLDEFRSLVSEMRRAAEETSGIRQFLILQLTHSGRQSIKPMIAYRNPVYEEKRPLSDENIVSDEYLDTLPALYVRTALLAVKAGFDGVDVKSCHGYLFQELLSAFSRKGRYGGAFENRTRLYLDTVRAVRAALPESISVTARLGVSDMVPYPNGFATTEQGEIDLTEADMLIEKLIGAGVEMLNVTVGNPYYNPHVNRPFALGAYDPGEHPLKGVARMLNGIALLKKAVPDMKIICSALSYLGVVAPQVCAGYINDGAFDFCGFGRTILAYPDYANDILAGGMKKEKICLCCSKCSEMMRAGGTPGCVVRDDLYREIYRKFKEDQK